jgi:predicted permease
VPQPADREVADELSFHIEERVREYVSAGMDEESARERARTRMGDLHAVQRECASLLSAERRAARRRDLLSDVVQDLRYAVRSGRRAPLFTVLAVVILAIGIGANTAVFSVLHAVLVEPLPYAGEGELVRVFGHRLDQPATPDRGPMSAANFVDYRERQRSFAAVAAFHSMVEEVTYLDGRTPLALKAARSEPGLLGVLGVRPVIGRDFGAAEATEAVVLLSHHAWQSLFGGTRDVLGRTASIAGVRMTVIGVLPAGFVGPAGAADFWVPLDLQPWLDHPISARRSHWLGAIGRLAPGVTVEQARKEASAIGAELARAYPTDNAGLTIAAMPLRDALAGETRTPLLVVMAAAALVLLVTCANLAGATLARLIGRRGEFAVRLALGAGRRRLARQLLTETTMLAVLGGIAGALLAHVAVSAFSGLAADMLPAYAEVGLDARMLVFALAATLATGIGCGLVPALAVAHSRPGGVLREEGRGASETRRTGRARSALVAVQVALSVSLVVGAALLARSFWVMRSAPLGFEPRNVVAVSIHLPEQSYPTFEAARGFFEEYEARLAALRGVEAVASSSFLPHDVLSRSGLTIQGVTWPAASGQPFVLISSVSDSYFGTMGIPLRAGRTFDGRDHGGAPQSVVISESMARRYWPRGNAVGARVRLGPDLEAPWAHVIGIVGDVRTNPTQAVQEPMAYLSSRQLPWSRRFVIIRARQDPLAVVAPARSALAELDPALPLFSASTLPDAIASSLSARHLPVILVAAFGATALLLASIGVYALFASMAAAREREFGVRMALGASRRAIGALVLRQGGLSLAIGLGAGAAGALVGARALRRLLFHIQPFDPTAILVSAVVIAACAILAMVGPLRRAIRTDPIGILR